MEPVSIAIVGTVIFGAVTALSIFIRSLLLSRDKDLNDRAQERALTQETKALEKLRAQMESNKRFSSHYQLLGSNNDSIKHIDQTIEQIFDKKKALIQQYGQVSAKESAAMIHGECTEEQKAVFDLLRKEIDQELRHYEARVQQLQMRREAMWDSHSKLLAHLVDQEKSRNEKLDEVYHKHSGMLEKIYIRHNHNAENVAIKTIDASTSAFKYITEPLKMLLKYFGLSTGISPDRAKEEASDRGDVSDAEDDINGDEDRMSDSEDEEALFETEERISDFTS